MTTGQPMNENDSAKASQGGRILAVMAWTALCGFIWFLWMASTVSVTTADPEATDAVVGMAACVVTGCTGGLWFFGLLTGLVIYGLIRR